MITSLLLALALIIAVFKLGNWVSTRLGQPAVLGGLVVGLLLGPSILNVFGYSYFEEFHISETVHVLGELGVIFLMFVAGLETELSELTKTGKPAVLAGTVGVIAPILLGLAVVLMFGYSLTQAVFIGIVLSATSVSISAQTLMELGKLRSREGMTLLGAAVVDDVLAIIVFSAFLTLSQGESGGLWSLVWIAVRMTLFLVGGSVLGMWILPRAVRRVQEYPVSAPVMSLVIVSFFGFAWAAEALGGVAAITGAFIAGVALSGSTLKHQIERDIYPMAYAFFVPMFLVSIGLTADLRSLSANDFIFAIVICLVAVLTKVIGAGLGAKAGNMTWRESLRVGVGMISRGEVGLIIAGIGARSVGIIDDNIFTIVVLMVLVTTFVTPPLLRMVFPKQENIQEKVHG
ncbi:MAG: cation:proton antiporter [Anaerolineae bacterium]|nr:cation:proton antiporter [Anaerolineae bacterium]